MAAIKKFQMSKIQTQKVSEKKTTILKRLKINLSISDIPVYTVIA